MRRRQQIAFARADSPVGQVVVETAEQIIAERDGLRLEVERLTAVLRNLCCGHEDDCSCTGCAAVFRGSFERVPDGK